MQRIWIAAFVVFALTLQVNAGEKRHRQKPAIRATFIRSSANNAESVEASAVNPCNSGPCQHSGTCRQTGTSSSFTCSCPPAWTGTTCQTRNPCGSSPCLNGGTCTNSGNNYTCTCTDMWTGSNCQTSNPCGSSPCSNGGQCQPLDDDNGFTCSCLEGFHGDTCDLPGNAVFQCQVTAVSYGAQTCPNVAYVELNGIRVWSASSCPGSSNLPNLPGINTILVNPIDCSASDVRWYDTSSSDDAAALLAKFIDYVADGSVLVGVSGENPSLHWDPALPVLLAAGVEVADFDAYGGNFVFVIQKGYPEKTKCLESTDPTTLLTASITGTSRENIEIVSNN